jgi:hypothetical protein
MTKVKPLADNEDHEPDKAAEGANGKTHGIVPAAEPQKNGTRRTSVTWSKDAPDGEAWAEPVSPVTPGGGEGEERGLSLFETGRSVGGRGSVAFSTVTSAFNNSDDAPTEQPLEKKRRSSFDLLVKSMTAARGSTFLGGDLPPALRASIVSKGSAGSTVGMKERTDGLLMSLVKQTSLLCAWIVSMCVFVSIAVLIMGWTSSPVLLTSDLMEVRKAELSAAMNVSSVSEHQVVKTWLSCPHEGEAKILAESSPSGQHDDGQASGVLYSRLSTDVDFRTVVWSMMTFRALATLAAGLSILYLAFDGNPVDRLMHVSIFYAILCLVIPVLPTSYVNPTVASVGLNWDGIRTSTIMAVSTLALQSVYVNRFIKKEDKILPNWSQTCIFLFVCWFMNATLIGVRELLRYAKAHEDTFDPLLAVTLALLLTRFSVMIMKAVWGRLPNFPIFAVGGLLYYPEVQIGVIVRLFIQALPDLSAAAAAATLASIIEVSSHIFACVFVVRKFKKLSRRGEAERATRGLDVFLTDYCTSIFAEHVAIFSAGITRFMWSPYVFDTGKPFVGGENDLQDHVTVWITQTLIEAVCDLLGLSIAHVMIQISIAGILKKPGFFPWWVFMTACSIAAALPPYALRIDCFMCKLNGQGLNYETASDELCMKGEL